MDHTRHTDAEGFTLLELTIAVAIFAVAIGVAAQTLISFYAAMDVQNQRVIAVNHCRGILSDMRILRDRNPNSADDPTNFQDSILSAYPEGVEMTGPEQLPMSRVVVNYENAAAASNPLVPTVQVRWNDMRGHPVSVSMSSAITDR